MPRTRVKIDTEEEAKKLATDKLLELKELAQKLSPKDRLQLLTMMAHMNITQLQETLNI